MKILIKKLLRLTENPPSVPPPAVFQLSDDILISIFMLNAEQPVNVDNWMDSDIPWPHHPMLQCTMRQTSQVCRRWRLVALTCPALWRNIDLSDTYSQWIQEIIKRAIPHDGFGRVSLTCYDWDALSLITPELLSHAHSYHGVLSMTLWSLLTNELVDPTTQLDSLFMFPAMSQNSFENLILTPPLLLGKPCLERLSFNSYFPIDIIHSNLSSITTLVIRDGLVRHTPPQVLTYSMTEIFSALANMPLLQELSLSVLFQDGIHQLYSIDLPFLTRLKLNGSYFSISQLLDNMNFPLPCSLRISCEGSNAAALPTNDMLYHILTPVAKRIAYSSTHNIKISLFTHIVEIKELPPMLNTVPRNHKDDAWNTKLCCAQFFFTTVGEWKTVLDPIIAIFGDIFQTTTHLTLPSLVDIYFPAIFVLDVLQPFIALDTINLNGYSHFVNLVSLFKTTSENGEEDLLPALRNIELFELSGDTSSLDALIDFLAWRVERNKGIHTFDFHFRPEQMTTQKIPITKGQLSQLQRIVADVNVYYLKDSDVYSRWLVKTAFLHPKLGNTGGYCRLEPFRDIPNEEVSNKQAKNRKTPRALSRRNLLF